MKEKVGREVTEATFIMRKGKEACLNLPSLVLYRNEFEQLPVPHRVAKKTHNGRCPAFMDPRGERPIPGGERSLSLLHSPDAG